MYVSTTFTSNMTEQLLITKNLKSYYYGKHFQNRFLSSVALAVSQNVMC